jgi:hypothetical protein
MASKELETVIGITLLNNRYIAQWTLEDVRELRKRLCEAIDNTSVLEAMSQMKPEG